MAGSFLTNLASSFGSAFRGLTNTIASIRLPTITFQNPIPVLQAGQAPIQQAFRAISSAVTPARVWLEKANPFGGGGLVRNPLVQDIAPVTRIFGSSVAPQQLTPQLVSDIISQPKALNTPQNNISSMAGSFDVSQLAALGGQALGQFAVGGGLGGGLSRGASRPVAVGRKYILFQNVQTGKLSVRSRIPTRRFAHRTRATGMEKMMQMLLPIVLIGSLHK